MFFWKISELSRKAIAYNIQLFIERPFISTVLNYWQNYFFSSVWLISSSNFMYKGNNIHVRKNLWSWKSAAGRKLLAPTTKVLEISFSLAMWPPSSYWPYSNEKHSNWGCHVTLNPCINSYFQSKPIYMQKNWHHSSIQFCHAGLYLDILCVRQ